MPEHHALAYVNKAISLYSKEDSETISLNDLHKLVTSIYELQEKYDLAKDYIRKNKVYGNDILLAKCELIEENYDKALELASEIYIGSISNIINTSFIQVEALLKTNKVKDSEGNNIDLPAKLFGELATKYATRQGGYTRIIKMGPRRGDSAERVIIELV